MKKSSYNIFVPCERMVIGFNTYRNMYIAISKNAYSTYNKESLDDLMRKFPNCYKNMQETGFLIEDDFDELASIRLRNKIECFASRKFQLMVFPTQDCNLKCWYCYETHQQNTKMTPEVMERIYLYVKILIENNSFDSFQMSFFGGEPLLYFDEIVFPLASRIKNLIESAGKKFISFFVTNASLINKQTIDKLVTLNPRLQITLDGIKEKHDKVRIWKKNNAPTYDTIIKVVKELIKRKELANFAITLRINYDNETLNNLHSLLRDLADVDKTKLHVHFERVWQTIDSVNNEQRELLLKTLIEFTEKGFVVNQGSFRQKDYSCPAECYNYAIINHDGSVHKCNGRTLTQETACGKIALTGQIEWDSNKIAKRIGLATFENPSCIKCKMLPLCMGPCSQKLMEMGGFDKQICSMKSVDTSLNDYILQEFRSKSLIKQYQTNGGVQ